MASANGQADGHVDAIKQEAEQKGAVVHSFDPDASPEEKAAAAGKHRSQLSSNKDSTTSPGGQEVQLQKGASTVVPTITVEHADDGEKKFVSDTNQTVEESNVNDVPGGLPAGPSPLIPDWYRVGWRQVSGIDDVQINDDEAKDKGVLDAFLSEQFYGSWYHNAGIIIFAVFSSHFLTRFGFGWGWLFIILAVCNTYYTTSMERVRRRSRDDIQRDLVKTRLASEHESADWMNNFLDRFWKIYEPVLSQTIVASVDQILSTNTPPFLDSLRLTHFTLGNKAPHIDKVRTFPSTAEDIVMMDWGISFTPNDVSDLTPKQLEAKQNPKIVLSVRVGKGITAAMPILVEDINFSGLMRIRMKLVANFPHIQIVDISFLEKPVIDYVLKPIGGETFGFDIANIPGLSSFIRDMTHATMGPMMYDPNVFTLNLEQMLSGKPLDAAIGVLQVTVQSARGIKGTKIGGGTPDPFVALTINDRTELARTKYKHNTYNPTWMETKFILINALNESLVLKLWDYNDHRKNSLLGDAMFDLSKLIEDATQENVVSPVLRDGKPKGELKYDLAFYPVLEAKEGQDAPDSSVGIVRLVLHQAKDLDSHRSYSGQPKPFAKVFVNDSKKPGFRTSTAKYTLNPIWEQAYEFLCADKDTSIVTVKIIDDRDLRSDPVVGYMSIRLVDLLESRDGESIRDWFPLSGCRSGKLRVSAEWKPLGMAGALQGADHYSPPIGVVRLVLDKATDVKNVEATLGGKSDPYVRVQVNNVTKARTEVVNNNLNPVWDQIVYIPTLFMECMDYQHLTRDRSLGSISLSVSELAKESDNDRYRHESTGIKDAQEPLRQDKGGGFKGQLHYRAEFIPALALKGIKFEKHTSTVPEQDTDGEVADDGSSISSSDMEDEHGERVGITVKGGGQTESAPSSPTTPRPPKKQSSGKDTDSDAASVQTADENADLKNGDSKPQDNEGVDMSEEELLAQQSGILVVNVVEGKISKKARLEVLLDDGYWPCFSTMKSRSTNAVWEHVGEGFIKEIDFSRVWLRLNEADEGEKDDIVAEWKGDAKPFLQQTLNGLSTFTLVDEDQRSHSTITLEARYVPVPVHLDPRESINNQGLLRVDLLDGREIHGADRSGKSDPYAVFTLNGQKVFKSQTKKKTLTPQWDENFTVSVPSRVGSDFSVEIFDWNQIEQAKSLGESVINLEDIEPFQAVERVLPLSSDKHGQKGEIRIRMLFQPEIIAKARKNTSTFSSAGRAVTQIGALPMSAGKGVFHGVTGVFKKDHEEESTEQTNGGSHHHHKNPLASVASVFKHKEKEPEPPVPSSLPSGQASHPVNASETDHPGANVFAANSNGNGNSNAPTSGTLHVTILDGKDFGESEIKPNESFKFFAGPTTPRLYLWVHDHKTLGKDKDLAEGEVDIWRHIAPGLGGSPVDVTVEMRSTGLLRLRLDFDASSGSISSGEKIQRFPSNLGASSSRFSIGRRRASEAVDRDD